MATELITTLDVNLRSTYYRKNAEDTIQQGGADFDLATPVNELILALALGFQHGTGSGQADLLFQKRFEISSGNYESINLGDGSLTNAFGESLVFAKVCVVYIKGITGSVRIPGDSTPPFKTILLGEGGLFNSGLGYAVVRPGEVICFGSDTGVVISSATNTFTLNAATGDIVTDVAIIGRSA